MFMYSKVMTNNRLEISSYQSKRLFDSNSLTIINKNLTVIYSQWAPRLERNWQKN